MPKSKPQSVWLVCLCGRILEAAKPSDTNTRHCLQCLKQSAPIPDGVLRRDSKEKTYRELAFEYADQLAMAYEAQKMLEGQKVAA